MADIRYYVIRLFVVVTVVIGGTEQTEKARDQSFGQCYSTKDCQDYYMAGGKWTREDCCSLGNHPCWCNENRVCQPSCGLSHQTDSGPLGRCYSTKDCQEYSMSGGKWTKEDCCLLGNPCWCDENKVCQPSCGLTQQKVSGVGPLGRCYSSRYCQRSYVAGGRWMKEDCCSIGNPCWCDEHGVCKPSCITYTADSTHDSTLGKCYSTRDCAGSYSVATGRWTRQDCCLVDNKNCWCDQRGRCQPTCGTTNQQTVTPLVLGKCYSTRDCRSYSKAGGKWTKEDCCLLGNHCWCDENGRCQPSCSDSTGQQEIDNLGKCYSTSDCRSYSLAGGKWSQKDCCLSGNRCWCDQNDNCRSSCSASSGQNKSHSKDHTTKPPVTTTDSFQSSQTPSTTGLTHNNPQLPISTGWSKILKPQTEGELLTSKPPNISGWLESSQLPTTDHDQFESGQSSRRVYLWCLVILVVVWPLALLSFWILRRCCKCGSTTINNLNYVQVNMDFKGAETKINDVA